MKAMTEYNRESKGNRRKTVRKTPPLLILYSLFTPPTQSNFGEYTSQLLDTVHSLNLKLISQFHSNLLVAG